LKTISSDDVLKLLYKEGWKLKNQRGSHVQLIHNEKKGKVTVPHPRKELNLKTYNSILMQAGLKKQK